MKRHSFFKALDFKGIGDILGCCRTGVLFAKCVRVVSLAALLPALPPGGIAASALASSPGSATLGSSIDVKDNASGYTIRVPIPEKNAPQMDVRMEGQMLRLSSGKTEGGARYEQNLFLPDADPLKTMDVKKEGNQLVIMVPKGSPQAANAAVSNQPAAAPAVQALPAQALQSQPMQVQYGSAPDSFGQALSMMARMHQQMEQMMNNFDNDDPLAGMIGGAFMNAIPSNNKVGLTDEGKAYVVTVRVPRDHADKVKVSVENDLLLRITIAAQSSGQNAGVQSLQSSNFTQMMTLPGAVQSDKMTSKYKDGNLRITLPKR